MGFTKNKMKAGKAWLRLFACITCAMVVSSCNSPVLKDSTDNPVDPGTGISASADGIGMKFTLPAEYWASTVTAAIAKLYYSVEGYYNDTPSKSVDLIVSPNGSTKDVSGKILGVESGIGYVLDIQLKNASSNVLRKSVEYFTVGALQDNFVNPAFSQTLGTLVVRNRREDDSFWTRGDSIVKFYDATFNLILEVGCKSANFGSYGRNDFAIGSGNYYRVDGNWILIRNIPPMTATVRVEYYDQNGAKIMEATSGSTSIAALGVTKFELSPSATQAAVLLGTASFLD